MKNLIFSILLFVFSTNTAFGSCDWKTGITPGPNNTFVYSQQCHEAVGQLVQANKDLETAIDLKNLALSTADQRTQLWEQNSLDQQDRLMKIDSDQKTNNFIYFGLGILATIGTGLAVAKLAGR